MSNTMVVLYDNYNLGFLQTFQPQITRPFKQTSVSAGKIYIKFHILRTEKVGTFKNLHQHFQVNESEVKTTDIKTCTRSNMT